MKTTLNLTVLLFSIFINTVLYSQNSKNILIFTGGKKTEHKQFLNVFDSINFINYNVVSQPESRALYNASELNQYDALVFFDVAQDITETEKTAFLSIYKKGIPVLFLHHAIVSYQTWNTYENIIGGRYYHARKDKDSSNIIPSTYKHNEYIPVHIINPNHPVTKNMTDFTILDEVYNKFKILPEVTPILSTTHPDSENTIAWTHTYLNSPIVYIQLGHDHQAFDDPNYRQLIKNALLWLTTKP